jgi:hypothetical protein
MRTKYFIAVTAVFIAFVLANSPIVLGQTIKSVQTKIPGALQTNPMPDLVIVSVGGVPNEITSYEGFGPIFFATITVKNVGNADAWFPPNTWIIGGPSQYTNISAPGQITNQPTATNTVIKPGQLWTATLAGKIKCFRGDVLEVRFQVDPQNRVAEKDKLNNEWKKLVTNRAVLGQSQKPDLIMESVSFSPANPTHYDRVMINVTMKNQGAGPAVFCENETIWMALLEQRGGSGGAGDRVVKAGEQFFGGLYIIEPNTLQRGCYRVKTTVDPNKAIPETNENNNSMISYLSMDNGDCSGLIAEDKKPKIGTAKELAPQSLNTVAKPIQQLK